LSIIRSAVEEDVPELVDLLSLLFSQESEFQPNRQRQTAGLKGIITDPAVGIILVAENDGRLVGMVNILYTVSTVLGGRVALLEDMVVDPSTRGTGIGSKLLNTAIETCKTNNCKRITLLTDQDNINAQRFYERHGFQQSTMIPLRYRI